MEEADLMANPELLKPLGRGGRAQQNLMELSKEELVTR